MVMPYEARWRDGDDGRALAGAYWEVTTDALFAAAESADGLVVLNANAAFTELVGLPVSVPRTNLKMASLPRPWGRRLISAVQEASKGLSDQTQFATTIDIQDDVYNVNSFTVRTSGGRQVVVGRVQRHTSKVALPDAFSREALKRVLDQTPDFIYVLDLVSGRPSFVSARAADTFGYSRELLQSKNAKELIALVHPQDVRNVQRHYLELRDLSQESVATIEFRCLTTTHGYRWFRSKATAFSRSASGQVDQIVGVISDIDALKKARISFTEMNARLKSVLASISDCYITVDNAYRITDVNEAAANWLNVKRRKLRGADIRDYAGPIAGTLANARNYMRVEKLEMESGIHPGRWIDLRVYPSLDGLSIFFSDITERKRAEEVAARSYALLNAALGALSGRLVVIDSEGMIVACNDAWREFASRVGHDPAPGTAFKWISLTESAARQTREAEQARVTVRALLSGKITTMSRAYRSGASSRRWYQVTAARFVHQHQVFVVFAVEDITESREARNAIEQSSKRVLAMQASERQRIAAELHDSTAQHLAVIGLNTAMLRSRSRQDTETLKLWEELDWCLSQASCEFRTLSYVLRPARLDAEGLLASLRRFAGEFETRTGILFHLRIDHRLNQVSVVKQKELLQLAHEVALQVRRKGMATRIVISQKLIRNTLHFVLQAVDANRLTQVSEALVSLSTVRYRLQRVGGDVNVRVRPSGIIFHAQVTCGNARRCNHAIHAQSHRHGLRSPIAQVKAYASELA